MKKLRRNMIFTVFLSLLLVFMVVLGAVNLMLSLINEEQASDMTALIQSNGGSVPNRVEFEQKFSSEDFAQGLTVNEETAFRTRFFIVTVDAEGKVTNYSLDHIAQVDEKEAQDLADSVSLSAQNTGYTSQYFYRITSGDNGTKDIIFLDCSETQSSQKLVLRITTYVAMVLIAVVTSVFALLSSSFLRPFEENEKRQKRFITDASHELKTPLAVISANADVLKMKDGDNQWLNNITDQTLRMSGLIGDLLSLTKAEEVGEEFVKETVDLVPLVKNLCTTFQENLDSRKISLVMDIPESLEIKGNPDMLQRLFSVLLENATKYTSENGTIEFKLSLDGHFAKASLYNTAELPEQFDCSHLFERFYRPDSSRNSSAGGHGIGLSIAETIVHNHRGKITAVKDRDGICFTVILPKNLK